MHYVVKGTLAQLTAGLDSKKVSEHGDQIVVSYPNGQAFFFRTRANEFEAVFSNANVAATVFGLAVASATMKSEVRNSAALRASLKQKGRRLIFNSAGNPVGVLPRLTICGTDPRSSFLDGEDIETAAELPDLKPVAAAKK